MENPTTAMRDAPMSGLANLMAMKGRENDSMLVHLSPSEVSNLNKLSGNTMTINPATGLPEGRSRLLEAVLPALLSIGVGIATGGASIPAQMAAQAAAGYGGSRLMGKEHDEALTSGLISGATAGLFGGTGSDIAASGKELGREAALKATQKKLIEGAIPAAMPTNLATAAGAQEFIKGGAKNVLAQANIADQIAKNAAKMLEREGAQALSAAGPFSGLKGFIASPTDIYGQIAAERAGGATLGEALTTPQAMKGLTGIVGREAGMNALVDQMRADANRPRDLSGPPRATGELWTQPYNMNLQGPYSESDITGAFIGDNITPINYYNQGYAKEGGLVQHMAQGGFTGLPVHMGIGGDISKFISPLYGLFSLLRGRKKSDTVQPTGQPIHTGQPIQLGNPMGGDPMSPPLPANIFEQANVQMAFGGKLGKALGIGGGSGSVSAGPRGSSQGGKGSGFFREMMKNPEVIALLQQGQQQPEQKMAGGGMPDMSNIPPEMLELLKAQASAPAPKAYDQLAALGQNPMQQMQGGGLTGAAEASGSMMPALQPLLQVASEEALQAVAQPRTYAQGGSFEGRVAGQGDGMSDQVPFNIEGQQPALLSRDEYVVPADVVAMVGDGSSNAGADQFDNFIGDIRTMKYGRQVQPRELNQGLGSLLGVA